MRDVSVTFRDRENIVWVVNRLPVIHECSICEQLISRNQIKVHSTVDDGVTEAAHLICAINDAKQYHPGVSGCLEVIATLFTACSG